MENLLYPKMVKCRDCPAVEKIENTIQYVKRDRNRYRICMKCYSKRKFSK